MSAGKEEEKRTMAMQNDQVTDTEHEARRAGLEELSGTGEQRAAEQMKERAEEMLSSAEERDPNYKKVGQALGSGRTSPAAPWKEPDPELADMQRELEKTDD